MDAVMVTGERLFFAVQPQIAWSVSAQDWDVPLPYYCEQPPTRRAGRRISRKQWKRQNAKMRRLYVKLDRAMGRRVAADYLRKAFR